MALPIEVKRRLFDNVYVCKHCKSKLRTSIFKILSNKVVCPKCGRRVFRLKKLPKK